MLLEINREIRFVAMRDDRWPNELKHFSQQIYRMSPAAVPLPFRGEGGLKKNCWPRSTVEAALETGLSVPIEYSRSTKSKVLSYGGHRCTK